MTREEAIAFIRYAKTLDHDEFAKEFYEITEAALREQEERRWIPVTERLPETEENVLVVVNGNPYSNITLERAYELAIFSIDDGWILEMWPEWEDPDVSHWMPLPEPPKEG